MLTFVSEALKLHLGCGRRRLDGYINVDRYDLAAADICADCIALPLPDCSVELIESHHLIEHYPYAQIFPLLIEWHRALRMGGRLVIETPDFAQVMRLFIEDQAGLAWSAWQGILYGSQEHPGQFHRSPQVFERLRWQLERVGFGEVVRLPATPSLPGGPYYENMRIEARKVRPRFQPPPASQRLADAIAACNRPPIVTSPYLASEARDFASTEGFKVAFLRFEALPDGWHWVDVMARSATSQHLQLWQGIKTPALYARADQVVMPELLTDLQPQQKMALANVIVQAGRTSAARQSVSGIGSAIINVDDGKHIDLPVESARIVAPGLTAVKRYLSELQGYLLARNLAHGKKVLILGSGTGYGAKLVAQTAYEVVAVEFERSLTAFAARCFSTSNIEWFHSPDLLSSLTDRKFDLLVVHNLLEHLAASERAALWTQAQGILEAGGVVLVSARNLFYHSGRFSPHPVSGLSLEDLMNLLAGDGLKVSFAGQRAIADGSAIPTECLLSSENRLDDDWLFALVQV